MEGLQREERVRPFAGRLITWPVRPIDDTAMAGAEVARRLGLTAASPVAAAAGFSR
jgi:hypothetical protein